MKKSDKHRPSITAIGAFTLMEVMVAIGILAISLVSIFNVQGSSIHIASRVKHMTAAVLLARSKMIDIEQELMEEGFSDFEEDMNGDFDEEGWPDFRWEATLTKMEFPTPPSMSGSGEGNNAYASMLSGYSSMITDMISNALRECNLTVEWGEGKDIQQMSFSTHFIEIGRAQMLETTVGGAKNLLDTGKSKNSKSNDDEPTSAKSRFKKSHDKIKDKPQFKGLFVPKK